MKVWDKFNMWTETTNESFAKSRQYKEYLQLPFHFVSLKAHLEDLN